MMICNSTLAKFKVRMLMPVASCACLSVIVFAGLGCAPADAKSPTAADVFRAAEEGDVDTVRKGIARNAAILTKSNQTGETLLHLAALRNQPDVIEVLVDAGADIEARDKPGFTPLHTAVTSVATAAATRLIDLGADPKARHIPAGRTDATGVSVLEMAAGRGDWRIVQLLIKTGVPVVDKEHPELDAPLHHACRNWTASRLRGKPGNTGNHLVIDALMQHMEDVNIRNYQRETPLHVAAAYGASDTVNHLLTAYPKVEIDAVTPEGKTALHLAVQSRFVEPKHADQRAATVRALLKHGAKLLPDDSGKTPLDLARATGNKALINAFQQE